MIGVKRSFQICRIETLDLYLAEAGELVDQMDQKAGSTLYHRKLWLIYSIVRNLDSCEVTVASSLLVRLHALLDKDVGLPDQDELTFMECDRDVVVQLSVQDTFIQVTIPYLFAYLVSGITHKSHDGEKAKLFLQEGIRSIKSIVFNKQLMKGQLEDGAAGWNKSILDRMQLIMCLHLADVFTTRSEYTQCLSVCLLTVLM